MLLALFFASSTFAAPSGADLLTACENSLVKGFSGEEGMMCTWYVTPCDCDYGQANEVPRVCLPQSPDVEALARTVIAGLAKQTELQAKDASFAAATILSSLYSCGDEY